MTVTTSGLPPKLGASERLHGLDAVRGLALLLGVVLHATMSFLPGPQLWVVADSQRSTTLSVAFFVIHVMRMTVFMLIAGYFGRMVYHRIGAWGFIRNRLRRIAVPLVVGWPLVLIAIIVVAGAAMPAGTVAPPPAKLSVTSFPLTHLWFLYLLLILYAGTLLLRAMVATVDRNEVFRGAIDRVVRGVLRPWSPLVLALPVAVALYLHPWWLPWFGVPTPDSSLIPNRAALTIYGLAFGLGWLVHRQTKILLPRLAREWWWHLSLAIGATVACLAMTSLTPMVMPLPLGSRKLWFAATYAVALWSWTFAMLGIGLRFLDGYSVWRRYLADASYWIYLAHLPLVMALQLMVRDWPLPWPIKFLFVLGVAMAILLISYAWLVRPTFIGATLNGRRIPRRTKQPLDLGAVVMRLLLLALLLPIPLAAQGGLKAPAPLPLDSVLARYTQAVGLTEKVTTRRTTLRISGLAPFEIPVVVEAIRPNLILKRVTLQGATQITGYDGQDAWRIDPFVSASGKPTDVPDAERGDLLEESDFDGAILGSGASANRIEYLGPAVVKVGTRDVAVHTIRIRFANGQQSVVSLDAATMLEIKRVQTRPVAGTPMELTIVSSDYRVVDGIKIPYLMEISAAGMPAPMRIMVDKVQVNVPLNRSQFTRPK